MTSINDEKKFIDANLTIKRFKRSTFDEMTAIVISILSVILLNFDVSGAICTYRGRVGYSTRKYSCQTAKSPPPQFPEYQPLNFVSSLLL
jgi:hypothetical protein